MREYPPLKYVHTDHPPSHILPRPINIGSWGLHSFWRVRSEELEAQPAPKRCGSISVVYSQLCEWCCVPAPWHAQRTANCDGPFLRRWHVVKIMPRNVTYSAVQRERTTLYSSHHPPPPTSTHTHTPPHTHLHTHTHTHTRYGRNLRKH